MLVHTLVCVRLCVYDFGKVSKCECLNFVRKCVRVFCAHQFSAQARTEE